MPLQSVGSDRDLDIDVGIGRLAAEVPTRRGAQQHGHRENHPGRAQLTGNLTRRTCGRPRRDAVVDDHRDPAAHVDPLATLEMAGHPCFKFFAFTTLDMAQGALADPRAPAHVGVEHPGTTFADGSHGQLGLERDSRPFGPQSHRAARAPPPQPRTANGNPASRQTQHDHILIAQSTPTAARADGPASTRSRNTVILNTSVDLPPHRPMHPASSGPGPTPHGAGCRPTSATHHRINA